MKKLMIALTIAASAQAAFAFDATTQITAITAAEIILSTAVTVATSEAVTISSELQKREAQKVLNEVQDYNQTGAISVYLENKIEALQAMDNNLSVDESVDLLISASELILSK